MLILLPPSEGKSAPVRGKPLDVDSLTFPELAGARRKVLSSLVALCSGDPEAARMTLGLPPGLADAVPRNAALETAPSAEARRIYSGVLYDALGVDSLTPAARRRANSRVLVTSSVFGLIRLTDRIPAYRLSGDATLPDVGTVASVWREALGDVLPPAARRHLIVDLRSGTYANFWRPPSELADRIVTVRVLQESNGQRSVVSHFNKATKGRLVRSLLEDGRDARTPEAFADLLRDLDWRVEPSPLSGAASTPDGSANTRGGSANTRGGSMRQRAGRHMPASYDVLVSAVSAL